MLDAGDDVTVAREVLGARHVLDQRGAAAMREEHDREAARASQRPRVRHSMRAHAPQRGDIEARRDLREEPLERRSEHVGVPHVRDR